MGVCTKEENLSLMTRMKKGRKPFTSNKLFHGKKRMFKKDFDKSKDELFYCGKKGHFAKECYERNKKEGRIHAFTVVEGGEPCQKKSSKEEHDRKEFYL